MLPVAGSKSAGLRIKLFVFVAALPYVYRCCKSSLSQSTIYLFRAIVYRLDRMAHGHRPAPFFSLYILFLHQTSTNAQRTFVRTVPDASTLTVAIAASVYEALMDHTAKQVHHMQLTGVKLVL